MYEWLLSVLTEHGLSSAGSRIDLALILKRGIRYEGSLGDEIPSSSKFMAGWKAFGDCGWTISCTSFALYHDIVQVIKKSGS